jgi:hypothetical protein
MKRTKGIAGKTGNHGITPKQMKLLEELLKGTKVAEICRKTQIPRSSVYYELKKPAFQEVYNAMKWTLYQR